METLKAMSLQMSENMERHAKTDEKITTLFAQSNELNEKQKVVEAHLSTPSPISAQPPPIPQHVPIYQPTSQLFQKWSFLIYTSIQATLQVWLPFYA